MKIEKVELQKTEKGFYYIDYGKETHGKTSFRLWVNHKIVENDMARIVGENREIIITEKGNYVLKEAKDKFLFMVGRECGFRGESWFEVKTPYIRIIEFKEYKSPRGNVGISTFGLVVTQREEIFVEEYADGRLYGKDEVFYKLYQIKGNNYLISDVCVPEDLREHL